MAEKQEIATIQTVDALTGNCEIREMTVDELEQIENSRLNALEIQAQIEAQIAARASALAKIAEISGLTEEEIAAL